MKKAKKRKLKEWTYYSNGYVSYVHEQANGEFISGYAPAHDLNAGGEQRRFKAVRAAFNFVGYPSFIDLPDLFGGD